MRPAMRGRFARSLVGAALGLLAAAPAVMAASANGRTSGEMSGIAPSHGFPNSMRHAHFAPFAASSSAPFALGLCCVGAPAPQVVIQLVETPPPPVPKRKLAPAPQASIATEAGVTVIRGVATH